MINKILDKRHKNNVETTCIIYNFSKSNISFKNINDLLAALIYTH